MNNTVTSVISFLILWLRSRPAILLRDSSNVFSANLVKPRKIYVTPILKSLSPHQHFSWNSFFSFLRHLAKNYSDYRSRFLMNGFLETNTYYFCADVIDQQDVLKHLAPVERAGIWKPAYFLFKRNYKGCTY